LTRVSKLERAKTAVITNKLKRDDVKTKRRELQVSKLVELELRKVKAAEIKHKDEDTVRRVKEIIAR